MEKMIIGIVSHLDFVKNLGKVLPKVKAFLECFDADELLALLAPAAKAGKIADAKQHAAELAQDAVALEKDLEALFHHK